MPRDRLWEWVHGECGDEMESGEIATHVRQCSDCSSSVREMRALADDLAGLGAEGTHRLDQDGRGDSAESGVGGASTPERIGGYHVVRKLGEGGMGVVFEARQQSPSRAVALKVVRAGYAADEYSLRLFRREAQALGRLNHPGIAAIHEAGVADGRHFFAMEMIDGRPLSEYVAAPRPGAAPLALAERLRLFQRVCEALAYAHQNGVLHRDLKPSNILVTPDGQPKVLDFGLARIVEGDQQPQASLLSETGRIMGTLPYMSPEQARGDAAAIDLRCDVYALGVVLYELLTGEMPFPAWGRPMHEVVRDICERPPRPPRALNRAVPVDVETICLKALAKEPSRRYQNAAEIADDMERYLSLRPILARPSSAAYRLQRFVARNTLAVGLLSTLFLVTLGAAIGLGVLARQLARERDVARLEAAKFIEINRVLTDTLQSPDPWKEGDRNVTVLSVLDVMARRIEAELRSDPLAAAAVRRTLGQTYRAYSEYDKAAEQLQFVHATLNERLGAEAPDTIAARGELAELLFLHGEIDQSEAMLREVLATRELLLPADRAGLANTLNSLGLIERRRAQREVSSPEAAEQRRGESERLLSRALGIRRELADAARAAVDDPRRLAQASNELAQSLNNLAGLFRERAAALDAADRSHAARAERHRAAPLYEEALALRRAHLGPRHPETAKMHNNLGRLLEDLGDLDEAQRNYQACLDVVLAGLGEDHQFTVITLLNLSATALARGEAEEADALLTRCAAIQERILPAGHPLLAEADALRERIAAARQGADD